MPQTTPKSKSTQLETGPPVILHGDDYQEAYTKSLEIAETESLTYIHPFDDPDVIAGQGTVGMEIFGSAQTKLISFLSQSEVVDSFQASPPT